MNFEIKEILHYDKCTGIFTWKNRNVSMFSHCKNPEQVCNGWNTRFANSIAGTVSKKLNGSYTRIGISVCGKTRNYFAHQLAFLYVSGVIPDQVDHEDHNGLNNIFSNLRIVDNTENRKNTRLQKNNSSGFCGVSWEKRHCRWKVSIGVGGKNIYGGEFTSLSDAIAKRKQMNIQHGFHENHGKKY